MKVLFIGDSLSVQYVSAFYNEAKKRDSLEAELFDYGKLRDNSFLSRVELHYKNGLRIYDLNRRVVKQCKENRYDLVFIYYSTLLYGQTIKRIKALGCKVFMYCNDNPFSKQYKLYIWRHLKKQIPYYDIVYAYRKSNIEDYKKYGANKVELLCSYYMSERNYYIPDTEIELDVPDVVYIGHKENDGREGYIKALLDANISIGLNHAWESFGYRNELTKVFSKNVATLQYNEILNKAKIAIVFLSTLNGDTYTRRCFEIPAVKTMMIAPYTEELAEMYKEGEEIVFYRNKEDFVDKIKYYLVNDDEREAIALGGYNRLIQSKNAVGDRINQIVEDYYG